MQEYMNQMLPTWSSSLTPLQAVIQQVKEQTETFHWYNAVYSGADEGDQFTEAQFLIFVWDTKFCTI